MPRWAGGQCRLTEERSLASDPTGVSSLEQLKATPFAPNSFLFLLVRHLLLEAMHLLLVASSGEAFLLLLFVFRSFSATTNLHVPAGLRRSREIECLGKPFGLGLGKPNALGLAIRAIFSATAERASPPALKPCRGLACEQTRFWVCLGAENVGFLVCLDSAARSKLSAAPNCRARKAQSSVGRTALASRSP